MVWRPPAVRSWPWASVDGLGLETRDEGAVPASLADLFHLPLFLLLLGQRLVDQRGRLGRGEGEQAVLVADDDVARLHDHAADRDRHVDLARAVLVGTAMVHA